jgi:hypothetical protein
MNPTIYLAGRAKPELARWVPGPDYVWSDDGSLTACDCLVAYFDGPDAAGPKRTSVDADPPDAIAEILAISAQAKPCFVIVLEPQTRAGRRAGWFDEYCSLISLPHVVVVPVLNFDEAVGALHVIRAMLRRQKSKTDKEN